MFSFNSPPPPKKKTLLDVTNEQTLGVWLFHCHIEWHVVSGLIATFVEDPLTLQKTLEIPKNHLDACAAADMPTKGNAVGNTADFLDLSNQNRPPALLPAG